MIIRLRALAATLAATALVAGWGCGTKDTGSGFDTSPGTGSSSGGSGSSSGGPSSSGGVSADGGPGYGGFGDASPAPPPPPSDAGHGCTNLQCQVQACEGGTPTTLSGKVTDPAGHNPLYNVVVYVPNSTGGKLDPIPLGVNADSCSCDALFSGQPMADTLTAADGTFHLTMAPSGSNIPLVVQIGKWRKEITIPTVNACQDNAIGSIALPKNHTDGMYASIPSFAVSTGGADSLECLLTRVGIDEAEFTGDPNTGSARVHVFQGSGGNSTANPSSPSSSASLWDSDADIERYDIVLLSCEGSPTTGANPQTIADYVSKGGRVFGEHFHYAFFANQSQFPNTADWSQAGSGGYQGSISGVVQTTLPNGKPFPEGTALQTWLSNVGALTGGQLTINVARHDAVVGASNVSAPWIQAAPGTAPASTQYFSWDMPFNASLNDAGVPQYCGRVVFSDLHVSGSNGPFGGEDYQTSTTVPTGCASTATLQPDEDALEFILFDLSSCVTPVGFPPAPPPPEPPEAGPPQWKNRPTAESLPRRDPEVSWHNAAIRLRSG